MDVKDIPEHCFTRRQVASLVKLLDPESTLKRSPNFNDSAKAREDLENAARWFISDLLQQNAPTDTQEIEKLDRIVAAAKKLIRAAADLEVAPYLKFEAGDALPQDRNLQDLTDGVKGLMQLAAKAAKRREQDRKNAEKYKRDCEALGLVWSRPKFPAMRVLVQRLYLLWWSVHGKPPSGSLSTNFMKFAQGYVAAMQVQTGKEHHDSDVNIDEQLDVSASGIQSHVRIINEQRAERARWQASRGKPKVK